VDLLWIRPAPNLAAGAARTKLPAPRRNAPARAKNPQDSAVLRRRREIASQTSKKPSTIIEISSAQISAILATYEMLRDEA
jgi:hypothetical protein